MGINCCFSARSEWYYMTMQCFIKTGLGPVQTGPDHPSWSGPVIDIHQDWRAWPCLQDFTGWAIRNPAHGFLPGNGKVRMQKDSSDTRFTPKMDIFKQTILNTAYIKTLEIFPSARESLSVQTSASRSVKNECCLRCSWLCQLVQKWLKFLYGAPYKKVHGNGYPILKPAFSPPLGNI